MRSGLVTTALHARDEQGTRALCTRRSPPSLPLQKSHSLHSVLLGARDVNVFVLPPPECRFPGGKRVFGVGTPVQLPGRIGKNMLQSELKKIVLHLRQLFGTLISEQKKGSALKPHHRDDIVGTK